MAYSGVSDSLVHSAQYFVLSCFNCVRLPRARRGHGEIGTVRHSFDAKQRTPAAMQAPPPEVNVRHAGVVRRFRACGTLLSLRAAVSRAFALGDALPTLVFETRSGDRAALDSELALRIAARAPPHAGVVVVASPPAPQLSLSDCVHSVFAAAFRAMAAPACFDDAQPSSPAPSSPPPSRPPTPPPAARPYTPPGAASPLLRVVRAGASSPTGSRAVGVRGAPLAPCDERSDGVGAEQSFRLHFGVRCGHCHMTPIAGARYRCTSCEVSLCEGCRRAGARCADRHTYTVFEHPWEAADEYRLAEPLSDGFRAPPAPLSLGDRGPRVMHLHFVLYTLGYLLTRAPGFRVDAYTLATCDAVARFQDDAPAAKPASDNARGAYSARTRAALLATFDDIDLRSAPHCRAAAAPPPVRTRLRSAMAA